MSIMELQFAMGELLERAGAKLRGRGRADCPRCGGRRTLSYTSSLFKCHHAGCGFQGSSHNLAKELGLARPLSLAEREELQQRLLCAREAAGQALGRVRSRRLELYEAHRSLLSILLSASERLKQNPEDERAWTALAYRGRELPKVRAELAMLESVPVGDRLALLNASNVDRERLVARMVIHGGVVDSNGKFVEVGDPISRRTRATEVQKVKPIS